MCVEDLCSLLLRERRGFKGIDIEAELVEKGAATGVGLGQQFVTAAEVICGQGPDLVIDPARRKRR